ncbi:NADP-dependent 3-hydroxy acid dehydrogenase YdfG [Pedobacter westerhofensis]|uniref:NADP-dependent 3-hydroxy acid dehydrogenase YdfG n=1 Tax=Pedobacter westerhofensis TaxID=425512 RepID=A0A521DFH1_9SPHI|nr:SDR family oxidoreductase [Pedobacter westerhofensis]SMO70457.1 NADP-dependent 3-hydroxy acid dehydrogenase YdfG [Pedobacter westerhofensis]
MAKTIFITGASAGIGKATAKFFSEKGWNVIATMRTPENEKELNLLSNVTLLPLDVTNPAQIKETAEKALALGDIDVVFNNAGYALLGILESTTDEQIVDLMETNFFGVVRVTQAFIPYFREKGSGLFITTGSSAGLMGFPVSSMYDASKWALEGWSESLSFELREVGIGIKTIEPGLVATSGGERMVIAQHPAYASLMGKFMTAIAPNENFSKPEHIAEVVYGAATDGTNQLRYVCGEDAKALYAQRLAGGDEAFRAGLVQMLSL